MICGFEVSQELINDIISTSFGGAAAGLALYLVQLGHAAYRDRRDSRIVFDWMTEQASPRHGWKFRSTRSIASHTNLTEDRVRYLCSTCKNIALSTGKEDDMWTIDVDLARQLEDLPD